MSFITEPGRSALALMACLAASTPGLAQTGDAAGGDGAFTVRMQLRRQLTVPGSAIPVDAPPLRYTIRRSRAEDGRWHTVTTIFAPATTALQPDVLVGRVEDDEDGALPRAYGPDGKEVRLPAPLEAGDVRRPLSGRALPTVATRAGASRGSSPLRGLLFRADGAAARKAALRRQHGAPTGRARDLDRYSSRAGDETTETLVNGSQLPVEVTVRRSGRLVSRTVHEYQTGAGGGHRLRAIHSETRGDGGVVARTDIDVIDVVEEGR